MLPLLSLRVEHDGSCSPKLRTSHHLKSTDRQNEVKALLCFLSHLIDLKCFPADSQVRVLSVCVCVCVCVSQCCDVIGRRSSCDVSSSGSEEAVRQSLEGLRDQTVRTRPHSRTLRPAAVWMSWSDAKLTVAYVALFFFSFFFLFIVFVLQSIL